MTVWIYINTAKEVGDVDHLMGILPAVQVLKFRAKARMRVTPPQHRTPHGQ